MMNVENAIETHYRKLVDVLNNEYEELYKNFGNEKLKILFSTLHAVLINSFDTLNHRLPTFEEPAHFWADPSRDLIQAIEIIEALERSLKKSEFAFGIEEYNQKKISLCKTFLSKSGGSTIPPNTEKIELYFTIPIFASLSIIVIENQKNVSDLKLIGSGSYAQVFKYTDNHYRKEFALKRAKEDLTEKELGRFRREYEQLSQLKSPYILEVFGFDEKNNSYTMELMDTSIDDYLSRNNSKLSFNDRIKLGRQIIQAFSYLHSKSILHRDISPKNILLKLYDDVKVVKLADFGLIKIPNSSLTSVNTEFKGYFNDPSLVLEGFDKYDILHETYAITRILFYVLSGKTRTDKVPQNMRDFVEKGLDSKNNRYKNLKELADAFLDIKPT